MPELLVIAVCLVINAVLSAAEMAFVTTGKPRLRELEQRGPTKQRKAARRALILRENPERTLSVIQLGITLVGAIAAAVGGAGAEEWLQPLLQSSFSLSPRTSQILSITIVVIPLTYLSVVVGELVPKSFALGRPLAILLRCARGLNTFERIFSPVISVLEQSTRMMLRLVRPFKRGDEATANTPETVELSLLAPQTREYVLNLVRLEGKKVADIYLPWSQTVHVKNTEPYEQVREVVLSSGHTRLPVVGKHGRLAGIVNTKEFMAANSGEWTRLIRSAVLVSRSDTLLRAFRKMQDNRSHLAIVTEAETLLGIVTMEDVIEEIIGEVFDEDDDGRLRRLMTKH